MSRWQRDLTDSTALRNLGTALGHSLLAYASLPARPRQARGRSGAPRRRPGGELGSARRGGAAGDAPPRRPEAYEKLKEHQPRQAPRPARSSRRSSRRCRSRPRRRSACSRSRPASYTGLAAELASALEGGSQVLSGFNWGQIKVPLLFVHHADDGCGATPYREAARLAARYPLITVHGGKPPESAPCEALLQPRLPTARKPKRSTPSRRGCWASRSRKKSAKCHGEPVNDLRRHDLPVVVPAVPGAAAHRAPDPAVVRRQRGGVDDLHAVLPGAAARRLRLRALADAAAARRQARAARRRCSRLRSRLLPIIAAERLEAARRPRSRSRASCCCSARPIGLPYFLLRTTSPLLQAWFCARAPGRRTRIACSRSRTSPRCSRCSATRSLVEPVARRRAAGWGWSWLFAAFALLCAGDGVADADATASTLQPS